MIAFIVVCITVCILYYLFPLIQVCGNSMFPTYVDNEIIFGTRLFKKSNLKVGEVILYRSPTDEYRIVVKRISKIMNDGKDFYFYCLGDNSDFSYDSRHYGYVSSDSIVCKVINQRRNMNNVCD